MSGGLRRNAGFASDPRFGGSVHPRFATRIKKEAGEIPGFLNLPLASVAFQWIVMVPNLRCAFGAGPFTAPGVGKVSVKAMV